MSQKDDGNKPIQDLSPKIRIILTAMPRPSGGLPEESQGTYWRNPIRARRYNGVGLRIASRRKMIYSSSQARAITALIITIGGNSVLQADYTVQYFDCNAPVNIQTYEKKSVCRSEDARDVTGMANH